MSRKHCEICHHIIKRKHNRRHYSLYKFGTTLRIHNKCYIAAKKYASRYHMPISKVIEFSYIGFIDINKHN